MMILAIIYRHSVVLVMDRFPNLFIYANHRCRW